MNRILLIDDDPVFLKLTSHYLEKNSLASLTFQSWEDARHYLKENTADLVLIDLHLPGISGIQVIHEIKKIKPEIPILMITAHSSIQTAIESVKAGAEDYIQKPCENSEILFKIQRAFEKVKKDSELKNLRQAVSGQFSFQNLITKDEELKKVYELAKTACDLDIIIYISGETGTGKEVLAKAIHFSSTRKNDPFVVVNCASLNENLIESELFGHKKGSFTSAHADKIGLCETVGKGTLFIDEIAELSPGVQKKLLRLLQEKEFERIGSTQVQKFYGRVIAASHRDLKKMVKSGTFREDLYFRLNVFPLHLNPLRERRVDLMDLAAHFLDLYSKKFSKNFTGFSSNAVKLMMGYRWQGNIRELEHFIERQVLISEGQIIDFSATELSGEAEAVSSLSQEEKKVAEYSQFIREKEKEYLIRLLEESKGSIEKAAEMAGIHRKTLYMKMKEYNLNKQDFKLE